MRYPKEEKHAEREIRADVSQTAIIPVRLVTLLRDGSGQSTRNSVPYVIDRG